MQQLTCNHVQISVYVYLLSLFPSVILTYPSIHTYIVVILIYLLRSITCREWSVGSKSKYSTGVVRSFQYGSRQVKLYEIVGI